MGQAHATENTEIETTKHRKQCNASKLSANPQTETMASLSSKISASDTTKKRFTRFGTIRRKLARTLRTGKASDYRRHIRDLVQSWSIKELQYLIKEYEWLQLLKEIKWESDKARNESPDISFDLKKLFKDKQNCADIKLIYNDKEFRIHKSFLMHRCQFFRSLLKNKNNDKTYVDTVKNIDAGLFETLLMYIYSGECNDENLVNLLPDLAKSFGELNNLQTDMLSLLQSDSYDILLVFNNVVSVNENSSNSSLDSNVQIPCHSAILCSRSTYFRSLLTKQLNCEESSNNGPIKLVLCESILPRAYIKAILQCMYTDVLDLSSIIKWKLADDGTGEADRLLTTAELAMELYEIAEFLDFKRLMQECEDVIVDNLNVSSLLGVLEWSSYPSGSKYIHRQALNYFSEEFCTLCKANVFLANVPERFLLEVIKSDFLQANEEFVLASVIKWGEWQIVKSNEKPGSSPSNSFPRRSPKRKDISNAALLEMISNLLPHVRLPHILPVNSSVLQFAYQRGLLQRPFPFDMVASEKRPPSIVYWVKEYQHSLYHRPRLFLNYLYELKLFVHEQLSGEHEITSRSNSSVSATLPSKLPDMLPTSTQINQSLQRKVKSNSPLSTLGMSIIDIMQLNEGIIKDMLQRERELKTSSIALQIVNLSPDNAEMLHYIQLQVTREYGLPDEVKDEIFKNKPDLIEDSDSSSSSKHSTLNKPHCSTEELSSPLQADLIADLLDSTLPEDFPDNELALSFSTPPLDVDGSFKIKGNGMSNEDSPLDLNFSLREHLIEQDLLADLADEKCPMFVYKT